MPYGLYVVHQTKGAAGQKFVPDFSVFISEHGKTYYFILNNPTFTSLIRFEKKGSAESPGKLSLWREQPSKSATPIPASGWYSISTTPAPSISTPS